MLLDRGIAVVGTGYRYIRDAQADGVKPPVMGCLDDCENALRFVKAHAAEWNLDTSRIGLAGGSAGACTALYLALKDDNGHGIEYSLDCEPSGACLVNYVVSIDDLSAYSALPAHGPGIVLRAGPNQQEQPRLSRPAALLRAAGRNERQKTPVL